MDTIFEKSGWFSVIKNAATEPHRFDKHGNLLIDYVEHAGDSAIRRRSVATADSEKKQREELREVHNEKGAGGVLAEGDGGSSSGSAGR